ncbi:hypothetical protein QJS10_CPA05g00754 [Acorus calamus]|uniref:SAC3/GANP/THP3 conserved domain-containing protein n=1 Tax=Acorus calamus TaxID=4465 RepID=A0AAV9F0A9_ACOCL|nr:hypothetical protein QJS10_CPA05g00754 [Acorus calamus]
MDGGGGSRNQGRSSRFRGPGNPSRSSRSDLRPSLPGTSDRRRPPSAVAENPTVEDRGGPFIGTCPDMCPAKERAQRERLRDLSAFERLNGNPGKTSSSLAVKKFCRTISASEMAVADIRPLPVLQDTLRYLFRLLETSGYQFEMVHDFVFDRMRSIRQDLSLQHIVNDQAIQMYEEMVKFHIIANHKLPKNSDKSLHHLNMEQLTKCLISLYDMYAINRKSNSINKNEAEFYSFYVLLHLGSNSQAMGDSLSLWFRKLAYPIVTSNEMCFARSLLRYFRLGNYKRFFSTAATEVSFLQLCLIEPFLNELRALAISYINYSCYKLHSYPVAHLSVILMMKETETESLCEACGLEICIDEDGNRFLPTKQTGFSLPRGFQNYSFQGFDRFERYFKIPF